MQLKTRISAILICAGFLTSSASAVTPGLSYEDGKITSGEFQIHTACMMPIQGKLSKSTMKGGESMSKQEDQWTTTMENIVEAHMKTAGVQLLQATDPLASGASDDEIRQVILQLNQKYGEISAQVDRHPKDIRKARFTLGDSTALLPCSAKADVIVFVEGQAVVSSGGKKAMGLLVAGAGSSYAVLAITMADAKTGEILALSNIEQYGEKFVDQPEDVFGQSLDKQFKKLQIGLYLNQKK
jgi:hypothetical protein